MKENGGTTRDRSSYYCGLWKGFDQQMEQAKKKVEGEYGLVLVPDAGLQKFTEDRFSNLRKSFNRLSGGNADAMNAGKDAGLKLKVSRGIDGKSTNSNKMIGA